VPRADIKLPRPRQKRIITDERRRQARELSRLNGVCGDSLAMEIGYENVIGKKLRKEEKQRCDNHQIDPNKNFPNAL